MEHKVLQHDPGYLFILYRIARHIILSVYDFVKIKIVWVQVRTGWPAGKVMFRVVKPK